MSSNKAIKIILVAGARPNFVKIAPIIKAMDKANLKRIVFDFSLVHTGQHFDSNMSADFFDQLGIRAVTGASGTVRQGLEAFLQGLLDGVAPCHESTDQCSRDHQTGQ